MTAPRLKLSLSFFSLLTAGFAHAAPGPEADPLNAFMAEKGLVSQIQRVEERATQKASELVVYAMGFLGVPYKLGGNSVETGFDCSGFVKAIYQQTVGLILPRKADEQALATQTIERSDLQPGDLVFFNTLHRAFSHVGIYVGDGKFVHSPKAGAEVRIESMNVSYWKRRFDGARRALATVSAESDTPSASATN
ncbi:MAG: C40 family peptidase [Rhodoferax sp.]|nr:C40 family peptidase [Rhodoferax sp.]NCP55422.1 C40 family peptidase [Rhodoferax sp.]OIP22825.1 MAG: glycoside hydrolase [Comamonadaceae bacterium CG2_30_60_41]PJC18215.1 MAG: glycoside hydrolase [Comamonadaceae bacterium CG_4_9_14_0_8_um_filter_60_18]